MRRLNSDEDLARGLAHLLAIDPRLAPLAQAVGPLAVRHRPPGFEGVARIVVAQMISLASAEAIWRRLEAGLGPVCGASIRAADDARLRACGLSGGKIRTLRAVAEAEASGLDLAALADVSPQEATAALTALPGIGLWSAEIFLLFCARHADIFPAGDLALQVAAGEGLALAGRPNEKEMRRIAEAWTPWRGVAATLLWAYYKAVREPRSGLPV